MVACQVQHYFLNRIFQPRIYTRVNGLDLIRLRGSCNKSASSRTISLPRCKSRGGQGSGRGYLIQDTFRNIEDSCGGLMVWVGLRSGGRLEYNSRQHIICHAP